MTPRRSKPSGKLSTTSQRTSSRAPAGRPEELTRFIAALPEDRLDNVFTHSSWAPDRASSYERLEFLGDSVLELAIARALYDRHPEFSEGRMAKIRSHVVSRASCAVVAPELGLGAGLPERGGGGGARAWPASSAWGRGSPRAAGSSRPRTSSSGFRATGTFSRRCSRLRLRRSISSM